MCKTTKGTQTASQDRYRAIQRVDSPGGPGGTPGPDPEASAPAALFGIPDYAPQYTFIAQASSQDNGFINLAHRFHENSGLRPKTVTSIEQILDLLNDPSKTGTGIINRIRIVAHIFVDSQNLIQPTNLLIPFVAGGTRLSLKRHFTGFAGTRIDALKSMMTFEVPGSPVETTYYIHRGAVAPILNQLGSSLSAIINQIPTDAFGEPSADFLEFIKLAASKWALQLNVITNTAAAAAANSGYDVLIADAIARLRNNPLAETQLTTLRDAIVGLGNSVSLNFAQPARPADYATNIAATLASTNGNVFQTKLNRVRQRFNRNSKIDIRGCQIGRDPDFLRAIQQFFGTSDTVRPTVSGPKWFQHFNEIGNITGLDSDARVAGLHTSGSPPYSATQVRQQFGAWATGFGITDAHLTFWQSTFNLSALAFCRLQWQANIPEARIIPIFRLDRIRSAGFTEVFTAIANVLLFNSNLPSAIQLNAMNALLPNLATWIGQLDGTISDSATSSQLTTRFTEFKTIYESVDRRFGSGSGPSAAQRVIPATAPAALTVQTLRDYQTQLKTFIDSDTNSKFQPAKRFLTTAQPQVQGDPAKMRYFLGLGLPFLLYNPSATNVDRNLLVAFTDSSGSTVSRRQNDAIKYWIRAQWQGNIPNGLGANTTFDNSRHTPWLVENRQTTTRLSTPPFVVSPTPEYHDKIVIIPA
jgi:hypothetical protein